MTSRQTMEVENVRSQIIDYLLALCGMLKKYYVIQSKGDDSKDVCKNFIVYTPISKIENSSIEIIYNKRI